MSSMPAEQQSIASSILQTVTKLFTAIGFGITTAIFNGVSRSPAKSGYNAHDPVEPYAATWYFAAAASGIGLILVPFLTIKTQGGGDQPEESEIVVQPKESQEKPIEEVAGSEVGSPVDGIAKELKI